MNCIASHPSIGQDLELCVHLCHTFQLYPLVSYSLSCIFFFTLPVYIAISLAFFFFFFFDVTHRSITLVCNTSSAPKLWRNQYSRVLSKKKKSPKCEKNFDRLP